MKACLSCWKRLSSPSKNPEAYVVEFVVNLIIDITFVMKRANHPDGLEPDRLHILGCSIRAGMGHSSITYRRCCTDGVIRESSDLNIVFLWDTSCQNSTTVWSLGTFDEITRWQYIVTGGVIGNPGPSTVNNWFKIERYLEDYKLVFCPEVCCSCKVTCGDVGVFYEDRTQWLGLSDVPLPVMFEKPLT
ncbi:hypothetical protein HHK36_024089 [Tetracentron sinense]|uniref:Uncharacterized protein n=1 Tax=Tetracentron sinense TaxID=13715 RepID=A0A834YN40_TETSI|nr:hypothetical protein HHK36_024089 [Tetracentron sinense]